MTPLAQTISRALIHFVWQGSMAGLLLWVILFTLRKRSANARYVASCAGLGLMGSMPIVTALFLYFRQGASAGVTQTVLRAANVSTTTFVTIYPIQWVWLSRLQSWALPAWSLGVVLFSARLLFGCKHAFLLRRHGRPAGDSIKEVVSRLTRMMGVHRAIQVLVSNIVETPSVVGWLRPVILLPTATLMGLTPLQLEAVLAHEIGHIRRYDYLVNVLQMLLETLLFYHPAVWWASKKIRIERELCCDDLAVRFSGNALRYARALTTLEKMRLNTPSVAMASTGGPLLYRIQRLVGATAKEYAPSRLPAVVAVALTSLCLVVNVSRVRGQDAPGVTVDLGGSRVIHRAPVPYPEQAQKQNVTGVIQVEVTLDAAGNVVDARVLSGPQELRKSALESVLNWHFSSEASGGTRVVTISYSDNGRQVQVGGIAKQRTQDFIQERIEEAKIAEAQVAANRADADRKMLELRVLRMKAEFLANGGRTVMEDRVVNTIDTTGLSDSVRADLLARLPIHEGEKLTADSIKRTAEVVRDFDEHLRLQFRSTVPGQVDIRIVVPSERQFQ